MYLEEVSIEEGHNPVLAAPPPVVHTVNTVYIAQADTLPPAAAPAAACSVKVARHKRTIPAVRRYLLL